MTLQSDLIAARALIDTPEKWRKDGDIDHASCCAVVAINRSTVARRFAGSSRAELQRALGRQLPERWEVWTRGDSYGEAIARYNDDPATTHADILALFDRAIKAAS